MKGIADVNRKTVEAMYQDAQSVFAAVDKLADAQSFAQAYKVYVDYLRQQTKVSVGRVEATASFASTKASEGFPRLRDGIEKVLPVRWQRRLIWPMIRSAVGGPRKPALIFYVQADRGLTPLR